MADQSISQLGTATTPLTGDELTVVVQNGVTKQTQLQDIADLGGPAGPVGPQGPTGPTGPGATIQVNSTVTGAPGTDASVTNVGSLQTAMFDFVIPRGDVGATGATGATGPVGPGVAAGGTAGQYLKKTSSVDYETTWDTLPVYVTEVSGTTNQINVATGTSTPVISIADDATLPGSVAVTVPKGTTAERSALTPVNGMIRYNTDTGLFEGRTAGVWSDFASGSGVTSIATGTGLTGGPITSTGTISIASTGVTAATYGSATQVPQIAINAQGQITSASNVTITASGLGAITAVNGTAGEIETSQVGTVVTVGIPTAPTLTGPVKVLGTGVTSITPFAQSMQAWEADNNNFETVYVRNVNNGSDASADFVAYNDASDVNSYFIDMGMNSSNFTSVTYPIFTPNSGYIFTGGGSSGQQSDLFIGTSNPASDIIFFTGDVLAANQRAMFNGTTGNLLLNTATDLGYTLNVGGSAYVEGVALFGDAVTLHQDPVTALEAATKQYVDSAVSTGFTVHSPAQLATAAALPTNTYNNGASGVGATLTAAINGALTVDSVAVTAGNRILVKDEVASANNGCYSVTSAGSAGTPYILTRVTDFDVAAPGEIANNAYFFVEAGTVNAGSSFVLSQTAAITVGTTSLPFTEFANQLNYVGGTNIDVTGLTISLTGTVAATNGGTGTSTVTTGDLLYGSATNTWSKLPLGSAYKSLTVNASGTQVEWNAIALNQSTAVSGALGATNGGTGQSSYAVGDILYASTTTALSKLADVATGNALISGGVGVAPSYGKIGLTTHVSGTLPIANGGTNSTATATAGGAGYGTGTAHAYTAAGTAGQVLVSNGASAPTWSGVSGGTF